MNKFFIRSLISILIIFVVLDADAKDRKIKSSQGGWAITEEWLAGYYYFLIQ